MVAAQPGMPVQGWPKRPSTRRNCRAACALTRRPTALAQRATSPPTLLFYCKEMRRRGPSPALTAMQDGVKPERKQLMQK